MSHTPIRWMETLRARRALIGCAAVMVAATPAAAAVLHVPSAFPTIADALSTAADGDVIQLAPGVYDTPFSFGFKAVTLRGNPAEPAATVLAPQTVDARELLTIPAFPEGGTILLDGLTIGGFATFSVIDGTLALRDCVVTADGGGLSVAFSVAGGSLTAERVAVADTGYEPHDVALFRIEQGYASLSQCDVLHGSRPLFAATSAECVLASSTIAGLNLDLLPTPVGAVQASGGSLVVSDCTFDAIAPGSGVVASWCDLTVAGSSFHAVADPFYGVDAPIHAQGPGVVLSGCHFTAGGSFEGPASAAVIASGNYLVEDCVVANNIPSDVGCGGLSVSGTGTIRSTSFTGNSTFGSGGALRIAGVASVETCQFDGNLGGEGDGAVRVTGTATFVGCRFAGNVGGDGFYAAPVHGGALGVVGGVAQLTDCLFLGNQALSNGKDVGFGGAISVRSGGSAALAGCTILGNVAQTAGGGVCLETGAALAISASSVCDNLPDQVFGAFSDGGGVVLCGCDGDLNGSGGVDAADLAILLGLWGPCGATAGDLVPDGQVDAADLAVLLGAWGPC